MTIKKIKKHTRLGVLLAIALSANFYNVNAQYLYDIGVGGGLPGYTGEVSNSPFSSPGYTLGAFLRSNIDSRFAVRVALGYGVVGGHTDDVLETYPGAQGICDFKFQTKFVSTELAFEVNFFPYPFQKTVMNSSNITPYSFVGIQNVVYMPTYGEEKDVGDGGNTFAVPFGVGVRWLLGKQWGVQFQFKAVKMFTDNFDNIQLADPYEFGSANMHLDDWLYTTTVMLTYSFGEDIWDCNCPGGYKRKRKR